MLNASRICRKFVPAKRQCHQIRSGIGRDEAARLAGIESEAPVEGGIAEDENSQPSGGLAAGNPFADQLAADTAPLAVRQHRDRAERKRGKRRLQPREHGMASDSFAFNSDQREDRIACIAQIVDQLRFGGLTASSTARMAATSPGVSDRTIIRHTSIDFTEAAASRNRGKKRSIISADDTRSTCAPMLMAATISPS
jgi:hypothetical protein